MRTAISIIFSGCLLTAGLPGCSSESGAAAPAPAVQPATATPPAPSVAPVPETELTAVITDPTFVLRIDPAGKYVAGQLARVDVALEPRGGYHINQEYPISIELTSDDGIALIKPKLGRSDAAKFNKKTALFEVPLTPKSQGQHRLLAKVRFAVCTDETCVPDTRTLALALVVE